MDSSDAADNDSCFETLQDTGYEHIKRKQVDRGGEFIILRMRHCTICFHHFYRQILYLIELFPTDQREERPSSQPLSAGDGSMRSIEFRMASRAI